MKNLDKIDIMSKAESNFLKVIVRPLWSLLNSFLSGELTEAIKFLDDNIIEWEKITNNCTSSDKRRSSIILKPLQFQLNPLLCEVKEEVFENKEIEENNQEEKKSCDNQFSGIPFDDSIDYSPRLVNPEQTKESNSPNIIHSSQESNVIMNKTKKVKKSDFANILD